MRRGCNVGVLEVEAFKQNSGGKKIPFEGEMQRQLDRCSSFRRARLVIGSRLTAVDVVHFQSCDVPAVANICSF